MYILPPIMDGVLSEEIVKTINEMGGNIPGWNFLGGNFPGGNFSGGSLMGGNFPYNHIKMQDLRYLQDLFHTICLILLQNLTKNNVYCYKVFCSQ